MSDISTPDSTPAPDQATTAPDQATTAPDQAAPGAPDAAGQGEDAGQAEAQANMDIATEQGYLGDKVDPLPNEAHSLESGPAAPPAVPDDLTPAGAPTVPAAEPPASA